MKKQNKCEALEGCSRKTRYTISDYKLKKTVSLCEAHFKSGMKAWFEENPIVRHLLHEGYL